MSEHDATGLSGSGAGAYHVIIPERGPEPRVEDDRRKEPRYPAKHEEANLGWYCGESYQTLPGRLEDVSSNGASLILDGAMWEGGDVWLCLSGAVRTEWVRGEVVGAAWVEGSDQRIRLRFHEACPFDFFKTAAWGNPEVSRSEPLPTTQTETVEGGDEPLAACAPRAPDADPDALRDLRVSVTLFQSTGATDEPRVGRPRDDERDDRVELVPKACVAALQLVGAMLVAGLIVVKLISTWQLDILLGFGKPAP